MRIGQIGCKGEREEPAASPIEANCQANAVFVEFSDASPAQSPSFHRVHHHVHVDHGGRQWHDVYLHPLHTGQ